MTDNGHVRARADGVEALFIHLLYLAALVLLREIFTTLFLGVAGHPFGRIVTFAESLSARDARKS